MVTALPDPPSVYISTGAFVPSRGGLETVLAAIVLHATSGRREAVTESPFCVPSWPEICNKIARDRAFEPH
jgi:hypothetical protein